MGTSAHLPLRARTLVFAALISGALSSIAAPAQMQWTKRSPATTPMVFSNTAMAYDSVLRTTVLIGVGTLYFAPLETYTWDGVDWSWRRTGNLPLGTNYAIAFDSVRHRMVIFGRVLNAMETWELHPSGWIQCKPKTVPPLRTGHAMAYDSNRKRVVMFGASLGSGAHNDTWEWDGTDWKQVIPIASPSARTGHAMAYDPIRKRVVLFGGGNSWARSDTWVWQGTTWVHKPSPVRPAPRFDHGLAFDAARGRIVLLGGQNGASRYNDTWEWDGTRWWPRAVSPLPPQKSEMAMAGHDATQRLVVFGGRSGGWPQPVIVRETWEYGGTHLTATGQPRRGKVVNLALASAAEAGLPYQLASSFDDTPIGVGPFLLGLQPDALFQVSVNGGWPTVLRNFRGKLDATGRAAASIAIPNLTVLVGKTIHTAFMIVDPKTSTLFRSVSNTLSLTVMP